ncbi:MAG: hypothetical protein WAN49_07620 [Pseudolabrys sp.]
MPGETIARSGPLSGAPDEDDYQAFCQALSTSERGRAFLAEHARRNKNVDTEQLLAAIEQLQSVMVAQSTPQATDPIRRRLRDLLDEIGTAQCDLEALLLATKTEALAELIARVESRISGILWSLRADPVPEVETAPPASEVGAEPTEEIERIHIAVVPLPDQPELPIPSPTASSPPAIARVRSEAVMAEVAFVETPPAPVGDCVNEPELTSRNRRASTRLLCQKVRCHRS